MRHGVAFLIQTVLFTALTAALCHATHVRVGIYQNDPKLFIDSDNKPAGFYVEVLDAIGRAEGWEIDYRPCVWEQCLQHLERGELDIMPDVAYSRDRAARFLFGDEAVLSSWSQLFKRHDAAIGSVLDLQDKRIAVVRESIQYAAMKEYLKQFGITARFVEVDDFEQAFRLLKEGTVDSALTNRFYGAHHRLDADADATNILIEPSILKFAFSKGNEALMEATDRHLRLMKTEPESIFYHAQQRWIAPPEPPVPGWVLWALLLSLFIILFLLALVMLFRWMVQVRSRELLKREREVAYLAHYDKLTGLPNRFLFTDHLIHAIKSAERSHKQLGLIFINLDNFKMINEAMGHHGGDSALKHVGRLLHGYETTARFGSDEFALLIEMVHPGEGELLRVVNRLAAALRDPFELDGQPIYITFSAGMAIYPDNGLDAPTLLNHADAAMRKAKSEGRNTFQFYNRDMTEKAYESLQMAARLRDAMEHDVLELHFQPKIDAQSGRLVGTEVLLRWPDADAGWIAPDRFIPIAEEHGLIASLGDYVLERALIQHALWRSQGLRPGTLAVNVSVLQLKANTFLQRLQELLQRHGCSAADLEIEVTESQLMIDPNVSIEVLGAMRALGIGVAVDDFGTGYSSLNYLKQLPISVLKIDKSFIGGIPDDSSDVELTRAVIAIAKGLHLKTVAEGVETEAQRQFLVENRCDTLQGYFLGRPMNAAALEDLLKEQAWN